MTELRDGFNTEIPESIMTPDRVESRLGALEFFDGMPTRDTADRLHDHLTVIRGVEAFLGGIPAASFEAIRRGLASVSAVASNQCVIFDGLMDSNSLFLTGNTDTVYDAFNTIHANDFTFDLYFGPSAPAGLEDNWIQTVNGKGWLVLLRLYGPLEPWFDQTWRPGEFELIN